MRTRISKLAATIGLAVGLVVIGGSVVGGIALAMDRGGSHAPAQSGEDSVSPGDDASEGTSQDATDDGTGTDHASDTGATVHDCDADDATDDTSPDDDTSPSDDACPTTSPSPDRHGGDPEPDDD